MATVEKETHKLSDIHREYLINRLAMAPFDRISQDGIVKEFKKTFKFSISAGLITYFKKEHANEINKVMRETADLAVKTIPITVKNFRLHEIWKIYGRAKNNKEKLMCLRAAQSEINEIGDKLVDAIRDSGTKHYHFNFGNMPDESIDRLAGQYSRMLRTLSGNN